MFPRLITRYGLATHLALLASLPFVLFPFLPSATLAQVVLCLSGIAALWILIEPSMRSGEHLSIARRRVIRSILHDFVFWFFLLAVLVAFVRYLNSDVVMQYVDGEWGVKKPEMPSLPSSSGHAGLLPLAVTVAIAVLLQGIRHGIGLAGRVSFGITASFVMGLGGFVMCGFACANVSSFMGAAHADFLEGPFWAPFWGPGFGVWLICALAFGAVAEARKWGAARIPFCIAVGGNACGLLFFSPPIVVTAFLVLALVFAIFCISFLARSGSMGAVARNMVLVVLGFATPFFFSSALVPHEIEFATSATDRDTSGNPVLVPADEIYAMKAGGFFSLDKEMKEVYSQRSLVLSKIAKDIWKKHPWYGAGTGTFGLHAPFLMAKGDIKSFKDKKKDWRTRILAMQLQEKRQNRSKGNMEETEYSWNELRPRNRDPHCAFNSYWTFLAERGLLSAAFAVVGLGLLLFAYFKRLVGAVVFLRDQDDSDVVLFACPPITWIVPFTVLFVLILAVYAPILGVAPMWLAIFIPLAVATASFPKKPDASKAPR